MGWRIAAGMDRRLKRHCGRDCCLSGPRLMGWASGRKVDWSSGRRRTEAFFEVVWMMMGCLTGRRMKVLSEARYESYWTSGLGIVGRRSNCSAFLGPFLRWGRER